MKERFLLYIIIGLAFYCGLRWPEAEPEFKGQIGVGECGGSRDGWEYRWYAERSDKAEWFVCRNIFNVTGGYSYTIPPGEYTLTETVVIK